MHIITQIFLEFFRMMWEIAWGLLFGFILSSIIRAFVPTETITSRLGKNAIGSIGLATFFGAISSSCSYAAASMSRTLVMKGATWSNAVAFMVSSTNLVFEIFIVVVTLLGWPFFGGEVIGGIIFIIISAWLFVLLFPKTIGQEARERVKASGNMDDDPHAHHSGHHHDENMDMARDHKHHNHHLTVHHPVFSLKEKFKQASGYFYMDIMMVGKDIFIGITLSAIVMVLVPDSFWNHLFLTGNSSIPHIFVLAWNDLIGILVAIFAFVCSVGNIVLANVLWQGGISFGGVIAFILSDLVTFPMLMVYQKYFGYKTMWYFLGILSISIFITALLLDYSFQLMHWIPKSPPHIMQMQQWKFQWDYASWLNVFFIPISILYFFKGKKSTTSANKRMLF
jgi:uncharacterized protein